MCTSHLPSECFSGDNWRTTSSQNVPASVSGSPCLYANMPVPNKRDSRFLLPLNLDRICNSLIKTSQMSCFTWFLKLEWKGGIFSLIPSPIFPSVLVLRVQLPCCEDALHQSLCLSALASTRQLASISKDENEGAFTGHQPRLRATQGDATQTERAALLMPAQSKPTSQVNDAFSHRAGDVCINTIKEWGFWSSRPLTSRKAVLTALHLTFISQVTFPFTTAEILSLP